jgi:hypothetical protein
MSLDRVGFAPEDMLAAGTIPTSTPYRPERQKTGLATAKYMAKFESSGAAEILSKALNSVTASVARHKTASSSRYFMLVSDFELGADWHRVSSFAWKEMSSIHHIQFLDCMRRISRGGLDTADPD